MATAKKVPNYDYVVTLTLSKQEAEVVRELTGHVYGTGPNRSASDRVFYALREAGVEGIPYDKAISSSSIVFKGENI